jgi:hypothetical protein
MIGLFGPERRPQFDLWTPAVNAVIGLLIPTLTFPIALACQWFLHIPMFNFIEPWFPVVVLTCFLVGFVCRGREPQNIWLLAAEVCLPTMLLGILAPFFIIALVCVLPATAAGVASGRSLKRRSIQRKSDD